MGGGAPGEGTATHSPSGLVSAHGVQRGVKPWKPPPFTAKDSQDSVRSHQAAA